MASKKKTAPADNAKKKPAPLLDEAGEDIGVANRNEQLYDNEMVAEQLADIYPLIESGFDDKHDQNEMIARCWDVFNCILNGNQAYYGDSQIYVPLVKDAIEARVTRYCNQLFPSDGRYCDVTAADGTVPYETIALLDHYVEAAKLRSSVGPSLIRMGDVTGQYSLMVDWNEIKRFITKRIERSEIALEGEEDQPETEVDLGKDENSTFHDVEDEEITEGTPGVTVLDPRDLLVLPATVDTLEEASLVAVSMRLSEKGIQGYVDKGIFDEDQADILMKQFSSTESDNKPNPGKKAVNAAGIQVSDDNVKTALIYMVWATLKISEKEERKCVIYYGGENLILGCTRNPYWNDKINIISTPAQKVAGSFWGKSRVEGGVERMQYAANDAVNMGFDSAQYALLPIVMTDPAANPKSGSMVLATAAIWEVDPKSTTFAQMPPVWKDAFTLVGACKDQIQQSMSTNPAMMPNGAAAKKPTQAQIAQEQQVALESTADVVNILEDGVFNDMVEWFYDLDYQFRDRPLLVRQFGPIGYEAIMQEIPPYQTGTNYRFRWYGSEGTKAAQEVQQMIAATNVLRGIPPEQLNGRILDLGPIVDHLAKVAFGPRLAPLVLKDQRHQLSMDPEEENEMLFEHFLVPVQVADEDIMHIQKHRAAAQALGDPDGYFRSHITMHVNQMHAKQQAQMQQQAAPPGQPGMPPQGGAPGQPGTPPPMVPRVGSQPGTMRNVQNPPGAIHPDNMVDPGRMPQ